MSIVSNVSNSCAPVLNPDLSGRSAMCIELSGQMNQETEKREGIFNATTQGKIGEGGKTAYRGDEVPSPNFRYGAARGITNSLKFRLL